jgi:hypothetical protein
MIGVPHGKEKLRNGANRVANTCEYMKYAAASTSTHRRIHALPHAMSSGSLPELSSVSWRT